MTEFPPDIVDAVAAHMNADHPDDSLVIVQAFAEPTATAAQMTGLDSDAGYWDATVGSERLEVKVAWLAPISNRAAIRTAVVELYDAGRAKLGLPAR
ncbi:MAG: hypothetical protein JWP10_1730 [Nocardioidaceae bacterium]|nr:hypothetical protein [Nocardioidaceae bacterium]